MKSASITDLDLQGHSGPSSRAQSNADLPGLRSCWREMLQDTLAAIAISTAIVGLAYIYWAA